MYFFVLTQVQVATELTHCFQGKSPGSFQKVPAGRSTFGPTGGKRKGGENGGKRGEKMGVKEGKKVGRKRG